MKVVFEVHEKLTTSQNGDLLPNYKLINNKLHQIISLSVSVLMKEKKCNYLDVYFQQNLSKMLGSQSSSDE